MEEILKAIEAHPIADGFIFILTIFVFSVRVRINVNPPNKEVNVKL